VASNLSVGQPERAAPSPEGVRVNRRLPAIRLIRSRNLLTVNPLTGSGPGTVSEK